MLGDFVTASGVGVGRLASGASEITFVGSVLVILGELVDGAVEGTLDAIEVGVALREADGSAVGETLGVPDGTAAQNQKQQN